MAADESRTETKCGTKMNLFNQYIANIDMDFFKSLCLKHGKIHTYKKKEYLSKENDVFPFWGFIESGVIRYFCTNKFEHKEYNVGFSFPNEFVADYPACLYDMKSELNIQALTTCKVYICSSVILKQLFEETIENQRVARIAAEQLFFQTYTRYLDMYRLTPEERYDKLLERYPEVLQFISLKEIASYLNITPVHMSRIRSKIFK
jgi:CRP-like cAMP-binding protein|nr:Crp/Fnr family transcriptional regulator [Bacteroides intestinalis]